MEGEEGRKEKKEEEKEGGGRLMGKGGDSGAQEVLKVILYCLKAYGLGLKEGPAHRFIFPEQTRPKVSPTPNKAYSPRCPKVLPACEL